jgi:hypothetical protein
MRFVSGRDMQTTQSWARNAVAAIGAASLLAGCASTRLVSQWRSPDIHGGPYRKVLLVAVAKTDETRRTTEDAFAGHLTPLGVGSVASYTVIPELGEVSKERIEKAVADSGADAALVCRLLKVDTITQVVPDHYPSPSFYGYYHVAWAGYYEPSMVYQTDVFTIEAKLFDAKSAALAWSGTTETTDPGDPRQEIGRYAEFIARHLKKLGLL